MMGTHYDIRHLLERLERLAARHDPGGRDAQFDFTGFNPRELARVGWLMRRLQGTDRAEAGLRMRSPANRRYYREKWEREPAAVYAVADQLPADLLADLGIGTGPLTDEEEVELLVLMVRADWEPPGLEAVLEDADEEEPWRG